MKQPQMRIDGYKELFPITQIHWRDGEITVVMVIFASEIAMYPISINTYANSHGNIKGTIIF